MTGGIDTSVLTGFVLLWAVIVPTPGPNSLMVTHVALTRGPRHLALAVTGNVLGVALLGTAALLGMTAVLEMLPWLKVGIEVLGGLYLLYFGGRLLWRSKAPLAVARPAGSAVDHHRGWSSFGLGVVTALSNAQAIVFIASIFAAAGVLAASLATGIACVAAMISMNATYLTLLGALFLLPAPRRVYARIGHLVQRTIGALFLGFGARLVIRAVLRVAA